VLLESGQAQIAFAGAAAAGNRRLNPARTYRAELTPAGIVVRRDDRRVDTFPAPLRIVAAGDALRLGGTALNGLTDGAYRGALELRPSPSGGLTAINELPLDAYVRGVVPGEVPARWPAEALKAQAVAARSYALTTDAGGAVFDQYPDTRSQVYRGLDGERPRTSGAVRATAGQVLRYQGRTAVTYFFSSSGGRTENVENVFPASRPFAYLRSVEDPYDGAAPRHRWRLVYSRAQVAARLHGLVRGAFRGIRVVDRGASPRIVSADVVGTAGSVRVSGATLKVRLGLYDTWASFPAFGSRRERAIAAQPLPLPVPAGAAPGGPAAPAPVSRTTGGFAWPALVWRSRGA
jgi:stage II sporulation protein D